MKLNRIAVAGWGVEIKESCGQVLDGNEIANGI